MEIGLESYTFTYSAGMGYRHLQPPGFVPLTVDDLLEKAAAAGLAGVSLDLGRWIDPEDTEELRRIRRRAEGMGLWLAAATGGTDVERLTVVLRAARELGCSVVRTVIGGARLGGDRRPMEGRWRSFMDKTLRDLQELARVAEDLGVTLAIENHQDLTADEIVHLLREVSSPWLGVVLDVANPLGTAEEPGTFYKKVMPFVKGAHLKDYRIRMTASGYLLCRCALGEGVVDFPRLFADFRRWAPDLRPTIELAALEARHVRVLEEDFWPEYPPRPAVELARTWRFLHQYAERDGSSEWRTPVELGLGGQAVAEYEERQFQESVAYLKKLLGGNLRAVS